MSSIKSSSDFKFVIDIYLLFSVKLLFGISSLNLISFFSSGFFLFKGISILFSSGFFFVNLSFNLNNSKSCKKGINVS